MSVRVLIPSLIGALLAILPWPSNHDPSGAGQAPLRCRQHAAPTYVEHSLTDHGHKTPCVDSCLRLWETSAPAFCQEETEQDEEESPHSIVLAPEAFQSHYPFVKVAGSARSILGTAFRLQSVPLRC
jgi:hypothetical protein